jgi:hypothetical protein
VIAPANTGNDNKSKTAVIKIDQQNNGILYIVNPSPRIFSIVTIKLIALTSEDAPAKCKLKIPKSTAGPECASIPDNGG